jgi:hypothetical protein
MIISTAVEILPYPKWKLISLWISEYTVLSPALMNSSEIWLVLSDLYLLNLSVAISLLYVLWSA